MAKKQLSSADQLTRSYDPKKAYPALYKMLEKCGALSAFYACQIHEPLKRSQPGKRTTNTTIFSIIV